MTTMTVLPTYGEWLMIPVFPGVKHNSTWISLAPMIQYEKLVT